MSGHSKWSTIKHQKAATDKVRGAVFTKLGNAITLAVRQGGGIDPEANFKLRLAIEKAREANMPKDNIERALAKAQGATEEGTLLEQVIYEGFAPGGIAVLVEGVTDNKQRTVSQVKNVFSQKGGSLGSTGSVSYLFTQVGEIHLKKQISPDVLLEKVLEVGADDIEVTDDDYIVFTNPHNLHRIKLELAKKELVIIKSELSFRPTTTIVVDAITTPKVVNLLISLENLDDIHKVYANAVLTTE